MATTHMKWADYMNEVALYMRYGYESDPSSPSSWAGQTLRNITDSVKRAYNRYLYPPGYVWSWMRRIGRFNTVSGKESYVMDEDFGGLRTPMTYGPNTGWAPLLEVPIGMVLRLRQRNSSGGYPNRVAFTTQRLEGAMEQRKVAELWPSPNGAWTLSYEQNVRATPLDAEHPVPLGGPETAECLRLLCLADAELRHRRINNGPQFQDAQRELASAMMNDRNNGPKHLGNMRPVGVVGEAQLVDRFVDATPWQVSVDTN